MNVDEGEQNDMEQSIQRVYNKQASIVAPLMATALMCNSRMVDRLSERSLERAALTETKEGIGSIAKRNLRPEAAADDDTQQEG